MFMRICRMDQWDWFSVCAQLGYPSRALSKVISEALTDLRSAAHDGNEIGLRMAQKRLCEMPIRRFEQCSFAFHKNHATGAFSTKGRTAEAKLTNVRPLCAL